MSVALTSKTANESVGGRGPLSKRDRFISPVKKPTFCIPYAGYFTIGPFHDTTFKSHATCTSSSS